MNCVRGLIGLGNTGLSRTPPSYNAILMFIFHSVPQVLPEFSKGVVPAPTNSAHGKTTVASANVPDDSVPADPAKRWPRSRLLVMPITHWMLQYAHLEG